MIVVSDTTPLISLLKINRIDLLEKLFGDVLIPQAVFDELTANERFQLEANRIRQTKFIVVKPVNNPESANILKRATGLDQGESEAIVLTDELKADLLSDTVKQTERLKIFWFYSSTVVLDWF
ncbi:DNA-binding protein [Fusicatenibacter sp.]